MWLDVHVIQCSKSQIIHGRVCQLGVALPSLYLLTLLILISFSPLCQQYQGQTIVVAMYWVYGSGPRIYFTKYKKKWEHLKTLSKLSEKLFFFFACFLMAVPTAYRSVWATDWIEPQLPETYTTTAVMPNP